MFWNMPDAWLYCGGSHRLGARDLATAQYHDRPGGGNPPISSHVSDIHDLLNGPGDHFTECRPPEYPSAEHQVAV